MGSESLSNSKNAADSYLGNFISLISKYEIRYEGVLYHLNVQDSTIGLKNVRSYGTEGRTKDGPQVPPSDKVYEYILFRGIDIKSQFVRVSLSPSSTASIVSKTLTESTQWQDTPALACRVYLNALPTHQFSPQVNSSNRSLAAQNAGSPLFSNQLYWHGYNETQINVPQAQQDPFAFQSLAMLSSHVNIPDLNSSPVLGLVKAPDPVNPVLSSTTSSSLHSTVAGSFTPVHCSVSPDMPSCSYITAPPSQAANNKLTVSSFPSSLEDTNITRSQPVGKAVSCPGAAASLSVLPTPVPYPGCSSGSLLTSSPSLLTSGQPAQTRSHLLSSTQHTYPDSKDATAFASPSSYTPAVNSTPATQPPLLPLPTPAQQSPHSTARFTEEFDFEAMNEKFKKDKVWDYLGKAKQKDKVEEGIEDDVFDQSLVGKQGLDLLSNFYLKPAYKKDDFFDTISSNSQSRGARNGQNSFSERMKLDSETFGNFQQRSHISYGPYGGHGTGCDQSYVGSYNWGRGYSYGSGRGQTYRDSYNWGSGYGYGGRGHRDMYF
ncbi:hypothetical protein DITRI_Ditri04bG0078700 [Diplodiscus trichospermus]